MHKDTNLNKWSFVKTSPQSNIFIDWFGLFQALILDNTRNKFTQIYQTHYEMHWVSKQTKQKKKHLIHIWFIKYGEY